MKTARLICGLVALVICGTGCVIDLTGSGRAGFGYSSKSEIYAIHDTETEGKDTTSKSELNIDKGILDWFFGSSDETSDPEPDPGL